MGEIKVGSRVQARDMAGNEKGVVIAIGRGNPFGYWTDMARVQFDMPSPYNGDTQAWMRFEQLELEVINLANVAPVTARELLALADVPNVRIEEYEEHRNDRPQQSGLINLEFEDGQGKRYTLY